MKGATLIENRSVEKLTERYCKLQFDKTVIEDQQGLLLLELKEMKE